LLLGRDQGFWNYHRQQLQESGLGYSRLRVAGGFIGAIRDAILKPLGGIATFRKAPAD
jgi:hypothetical protein